MPNVRLAGTALCLLLLCAGLGADAEAGGKILDGRAAPDISFSDGLNGGAGARLSAYKGRPVLVMFWLRDCPHCRRELPRIQQLHDQWGKAGLQVLTVVHKFGSSDVAPVMRQLGYDFPVGSDTAGTAAKKYGVTSRPATYLVGIDGRVKSSNGAPGDVIAKELGRYRLAKLGKVPKDMQELRNAVWQGRMGSALKQAEAAAAIDGATAETKAIAQRTQEIARETLTARAHWASKLARSGRRVEAQNEIAAIQRAFKGTSLESEAARLGR